MKTYTEKEIIAAYKKHIGYHLQDPEIARASLEQFLETLRSEKRV
jgi:DNA integrity scanning protein DisA with diadenylate cyclase activity